MLGFLKRIFKRKTVAEYSPVIIKVNNIVVYAKPMYFIESTLPVSDQGGLFLNKGDIVTFCKVKGKYRAPKTGYYFWDYYTLSGRSSEARLTINNMHVNKTWPDRYFSNNLAVF
tara:strand:- start:1557 stop:1898 length:342 start_codon:yes stop_codon:yes gene_type:complete